MILTRRRALIGSALAAPAIIYRADAQTTCGCSAPPPAPGTPTTPAAATANGFNTLAFFAGFDSPSELTSNRSGSTVAKFYQTGGLQYTIANSILTMTNSISGSQSGVSSCANANAPLTTPGAIRAGNGNGVRFRYGCFEALLRIDPTKIFGPGWIAWWANGFQHNVANDHTKNSVEMDFFEYFNPGGGGSSTGLWNWASDPVTTVPTFASAGWGDAMYLVDQTTANNAAGNFASWFLVGGAMTSAHIEVYWNTPTRRAQAITDTTLFRIFTNQNYDVKDGNGIHYQAKFDAVNLCDLQLLIGGSSGSPFDLDYIAVWQ